MVEVVRPLVRRFHRSARTVATLALTLMLTIGVATACSTPTVGDVAPYAVATQNDPAFQGTFRHEFADVDDVRMHYVTGGSGTPVVLIHGWPQTWYGWWPIMPALAEHHTVYAVDLSGSHRWPARSSAWSEPSPTRRRSGSHSRSTRRSPGDASSETPSTSRWPGLRYSLDPSVNKHR